MLHHFLPSAHLGCRDSTLDLHRVVNRRTRAMRVIFHGSDMIRSSHVFLSCPGDRPGLMVSQLTLTSRQFFSPLNRAKMI